MTNFDIIILLVLSIPSIIGVFYGFLNILFSLLSWSVAFGISMKLLPYISPLLESYIEPDLLRMVAAFVLVFIILLMLLSLLSFFLVKLLGRAGLTAADRMLGFAFGATLGALIVVAVVFLGGFTSIPQESWWQDSKMVDPFQRISIWCRGFLPESIIESHSYQLTETDINREF